MITEKQKAAADAVLDHIVHTAASRHKDYSAEYTIEHAIHLQKACNAYATLVAAITETITELHSEQVADLKHGTGCNDTAGF